MFIFYLETPDGVNNVFFERQARIFCCAKVMLNLVWVPLRGFDPGCRIGIRMLGPHRRMVLGFEP